MTDLRDARFKKALEEAPDADARAPLAIAESIRAAARSAAAQPARATAQSAPWWRRVWAVTGQPRGPWGAALATVLVAVLVTVLWRDGPLPDAQPLATAPIPSDQQVALEAVAPHAEPVAAPPQTTARPAREKARKTPAPAAAAKVQSQQKEVAADATASVRIEQPESPAAAMEQRTAPVAVAAAPAPAPPAAAAAPPAAPPLSAALAKRPLQSTLDAKPSAATVTMTVDVALEGLAATARGEPAQRLEAYLQRLEQQVAWAVLEPAAGADPAPVLQLRWNVQGKLLASFSLHGTVAHWLREGQPGLRGSLDDKQLAELTALVRAAIAPEAGSSTP